MVQGIGQGLAVGRNREGRPALVVGWRLADGDLWFPTHGAMKLRHGWGTRLQGLWSHLPVPGAPGFGGWACFCRGPGALAGKLLKIYEIVTQVILLSQIRSGSIVDSIVTSLSPFSLYRRTRVWRLRSRIV